MDIFALLGTHRTQNITHVIYITPNDKFFYVYHVMFILKYWPYEAIQRGRYTPKRIPSVVLTSNLENAVFIILLSLKRLETIAVQDG